MPTGRIALRQVRLAAGLTQKALADQVGVVRPEIARWEAGGRLPRVDTAVLLARALETTVEAIWPPLDPYESEARDVPAPGPRDRPPGGPDGRCTEA